MDPATTAAALVAEASDAKREAQRLQREAAHKLREAERICQKFGIDFVLIRHPGKEGAVSE